MKKYGDRLTDIKIIFPNKRPRYYLLEELKNNLRTPFFPPEIFSMDEFVFNIYNKIFPDKRLCESDEELIYLLFLSVKKLKKHKIFKAEMSDSLENFYFFGKKFLNVINELLIFDVDFKNIENYKLYDDYTKEEIIELLDNFSEIMNYFFEYLENEKMYFRGQAYNFVSKNLESKDEIIAFCGFNALNKSEEMIIKHFLDRDSILILQSNVNEWENDINSTFYFHYLLKEKWGFKPEIICDEEIDNTNIEVFEAVDFHSQIFSLSDIDKKNTAIVLPDNNILLPVIYRIKDLSVKEFNVTMGFPFERTPIYSIFITYKELFLNMKDEKVYISDYINLIKNPYIKHLNIGKDFSSIVYIVEKSLKESNKDTGITFASIEEIEEIVRDKLEKKGVFEDFRKFNNEFISIFYNIKNLQRLLISLNDIIKIIFKRADFKNNIFVNQFLIAISERFENIAYSIIGEYTFKDSKKLWNFLDSLIRDIQVPFTGEPLVGLQVLGFLETRCLNFDNVFIFDVNEGCIPENKKIDPVLPTELRRILGLPSYKEIESMYAYNFYRLIYGARNAKLVYINSESQDQDNYRSRFLEMILWNNEKKGKKIKIDRIILPAIYSEKERFEYKKNDEIITMLKSFEYSSSKLDDYFRCSMRFLLKYILRIKPYLTVEEELDGGKIGSFVHEFLKEYFAQFKGEKCVVDEKGFFQMFKDMFDTFMSKYERAKKELLRESLKLRFEQMMKNEGFYGRIIYDVEREIDGFIDVNGEKIKLKGIIDRIDIKEGNKYVIIDYKTSSNVDNPFKRTKPKKNHEKGAFSSKEIRELFTTLQPSCYIYLFSKETGIEPEKIEFNFMLFKNIKNVNEDGGDWEYLYKGLKGILSEIFNPDVPFTLTEDDKNCRYCDYIYFCGMKERGW